MSFTLVALAAAASFVCEAPSHHDGDNVRCANVQTAIRLQGIDAPEMPGACRPGRDCTPGDPYAARDYLRSLTRGRQVQCTPEGEDVYGRIIARCSAGGVDLSCAMIASGQAVPRYAAIDCGGGNYAEPQQVVPQPPGPQPPRAPLPAPIFAPEGAASVPEQPATASPLLLAPLWLLLINLATWLSFAADKRRAERYLKRFHPERRIPETTLLGLAALGGSPAAWAAMLRLRHKSAKPAFQTRLLLISGVQAGAVLGGLWWWLAG